MVERGTKVVTGSARYYFNPEGKDFKQKVVDLKFQDSYSMISNPLRDFPESFKLEGVKKD